MNNKRTIIFKTEKEEIVLPITPQEYEIAHSNAYSKVNICNIGDVYAGGLREAETVKLISFFPANNYQFANNSDTEPQKYIDAIDNLSKKRTLFRLIIGGTKINIPVRVQAFLYGERDASNDVEYSVTLCVHRTLETVEAAGWTVPKRKNNPPKKKKSNNDDNDKDRTNEPLPYKKPPVSGYIYTNGGSFNSNNVEEVQ